MNDSDPAVAPAEPGIVGRVLRVGGALLEAHLVYAQNEAARDRDRLVRGITLAAIAVMLLALASVGVHAAALFALHDRGIRWTHASLALCVADMLLASAFFLRARVRMRPPWMRETRAMVRRTVDSLRG